MIIPGKLYLIPSPISDNTALPIIPSQNQSVMKSVKLYFAENPRTARRFLSRMNIGIEINQLRIETLDKDTDEPMMKFYAGLILSGEDAGILSEAGCPGIADPGSGLVAQAHRLGIRVIPLSGPSSIFLALMASGFNGQHFTFHGYLPVKKEKLIGKILEMERSVLQKDQTQIFMETPYRNSNLFHILINTLKNHLKLGIAIDLTGENEKIIVKTIKEWKNEPVELIKKPAIFLIYI